MNVLQNSSFERLLEEQITYTIKIIVIKGEPRIDA